MNTATLYQDFSSDKVLENRTGSASAADVEEAKLQSFEDGYQAGWDDAAKAQASLDMSVSSALAANLQDASFEYHEVRNQLTKTVHEIMQGVVDAILPDVARQSLGAHIVQLVEAHTRDAVTRTIQLRVSETSRELVERVLPETPVAYEVTVDSCLAPDQAVLQLSETEHEIDLGRVVKDVNAAVADYFETQTSEGKDDRSA